MKGGVSTGRTHLGRGRFGELGAAGDLLSFPSTANPQQDSRLFAQARCALGRLGVITEVTLKVVPLRKILLDPR